MNTRTAVFEQEAPIGTNCLPPVAQPKPEEYYPNINVVTIGPRIYATRALSPLSWEPYNLLTSGLSLSPASTIPQQSPSSIQTDPYTLLDYIAKAAVITSKDAVSRRITNLIRAYQSESDSGDFPSLLSINDFYRFMQSTELDIRTPSLTISAAGLLRAQWNQGRERVLAQFRGDEDVDYVVVVHHPKHWGKFERKSGRCLQTNLLDNLSDRQKELLTQE